MTSLFDKLILGHYNNKKQAYSNPTRWPQINILYTKIDENVLDLKQWYNYQGESNPYRHFHVTYEHLDPVTVYTSSVNVLTGEESCKWQFGYFDGWWFGEIREECILRNTRVVSEVQFNGTVYMSRDTGYDLETGKFAWGKEEHEGMFRFERLNNQRKLDLTQYNGRDED